MVRRVRRLVELQELRQELQQAQVEQVMVHRPRAWTRQLLGPELRGDKERRP